MSRLTQICVFEIIEWSELITEDQFLLRLAIEARDFARASQSHFRVGAALSTGHGRGEAYAVFSGCNLEDVAFNGTVHAEMNALGAMVRVNPVSRCEVIAVALGPKTMEISSPPKRQGDAITDLRKITYTVCGHCRTMLAQYGLPQGGTRVLALQPNGQIVVCTIADLYPVGFAF